MLSLTANKLVRLLIQDHHRLEAEVSLYYRQQEAQATRLSQAEARSPTTVNGNPPLHLLTRQEEKVYQLLRQGKSNKQIAVQLSISPYTVGKHVQSILRKLGASNCTQAVSHASL